MADYAGGVITYSEFGGTRNNRAASADLPWPQWSSKQFKGRSATTPSLGGVPPTTHYKMRAQDSGAASPGYVTWTVTGAPDFDGKDYAGGTPTPVGPMVPGSAVVATDYKE
jgi:hypothetical protein